MALPRGTTRGSTDEVEAIHRFNRFYIPQMQSIEEARLAVGFTPRDLPVFLELAKPHGSTASWITHALKMHPTQVSRTLRDFRAHRLYTELPEPFDNRIRRLRLTKEGESLKIAIQRAADKAVGEILRRVPYADRDALVAALDTAAWLLGSRQVPRPTAPATSAARSTPASA
jgi:DNA-binding MarR family transcriptional regulator